MTASDARQDDVSSTDAVELVDLRPQQSTPSASAVHRGGYAGVGETYGLVEHWIDANGYVVTGRPWECYSDDPGTPQPRTQVYLPCRPATEG